MRFGLNFCGGIFFLKCQNQGDRIGGVVLTCQILCKHNSSCNVVPLFKFSDKIHCSNLSPKPAFPAHLAQNLPEHACMHAVYHLLIGQNVLKYKGQKYYTKLY